MKTFEQERGALSGNAERLPEHEEALFAVLEPEMERRAIKMDDLQGVYTAEEIARDKAEAQELKKKYANDGKRESIKKGGRLFEGIAYWGIEKGGFLGNDASYTPTAPYDDYKHGVDGVIQFEEGRGSTSHVAVGIDVTKNRVDLGSKFGDIKASIRSGKLSFVKYFTAENYRGELKNVSRVVIGADERMADDISHLILTEIRLRDTLRGMKRTPDDDGNFESRKAELLKRIEINAAKLGDHSLQWIMLFEMRDELAAFREFALKHKQIKIAEECGKIYEIVQDVIASKEEDLAEKGKERDEEAIRRDQVYALIKEELENF